MISYLAGTVRDVRMPYVTVVTNGIGFLVQVPSKYNLAVGASVELDIYTHVHQDNGMQLFGFFNADERALFTLIIGCSGIGPKIALAVLGGLSPTLFVSAVMTGDIRAFSGIEGIGPKKAENIILQLKDKVGKLALTGLDHLESPAVASIKQLSDVLTSLGYTRSETTACLEQVKKEGLFERASFDELIRKALAFMTKKSIA